MQVESRGLKMSLDVRDKVTKKMTSTLRASKTSKVVGKSLGINGQRMVTRGAAKTLKLSERNPKIVTIKSTGLTEKIKKLHTKPRDCDEPMDVDLEVFGQILPKVNIFPPGVSNLDEEDSQNLFMVSENVRDIYNYLRHLEKQQSVKEDSLKGCTVTPKMRAVLINWLMEVHQQFNLLQETLYLTVAIIDRFFSSAVARIKRNRLQLLGVTAMFVASKYEEMYTPEIGDFVYISDNACSKSDIRSMEIEILKTLRFELGRPLSINFLRRNSKVGGVSTEHHNFAKFALELALVEYALAHIHPSEMAASALLIALFVVDGASSVDQVWSLNLSFYSGYTYKALKPVVRQLAGVLLSSERSNFQTVVNKYKQRARHLMASLSTEPYQKQLQKLSKID